MENEEYKILQHISDTLDEILAFMKKPKNIFLRILEVAGAVVSVLAIIGIAEIIYNLVFGG
ncbi:MAG: hypothetical protein FWD40_00745 [Treponema sp.]|nr:hypothetical protein [Treponema sp.]